MEDGQRVDKKSLGWLLLAGLGALFLAAKASQDKLWAAVREPPPYRVSGPGVSVIIPALEEQKYLPNLLASIAHQTYGPIETVICDQSSPEGKRLTKLIASHYGAEVVDLEEHHVSRARNEAARVASQSIFLIPDADSILPHEYIEKAVRTLAQGYVLAHGVKAIYDDIVVNMGYTALARPFWSLLNTSGGLAIRREDYWAVGGYDESLNPIQGFREDLDFGRRVAQRFGKERIVLLDIPIGVSARRFWKEGFLPHKLWAGGAVRHRIADHRIGERVKLLLP